MKLEDAYEDTRRAGTTLADELKCAILLRYLSGALKTHLSLSLKETSTYLELREEILRWDRAHQKWSNLVSTTDESSDVKPRKSTEIQGKGKGHDKGKGKNDKGNQKESQSRKVKTKARPRTTMTKAVNLERESQSKIQAKEKVNEFAVSATSLATWPKTAGTM